MSKGESAAGCSRQTNQNKCETGCSSPDEPNDQSDERELPTPDDVLWSFIDECPDLVDIPVAFEEGTPLREDYTEVETESWDSDVLYYCGKCESTFSPSNQSPTDHVSDTHGDLVDRLSVSPADAADSWVARFSVCGAHIAEVEGVPWAVAVE
jgi:hypothetical protein